MRKKLKEALAMSYNFKGEDVLNIFKSMNEQDEREMKDRGGKPKPQYEKDRGGKPQRYNNKYDDRKSDNHKTKFLNLVRYYSRGDTNPKDDIEDLVKREFDDFIYNYKVILEDEEGKIKHTSYTVTALKSEKFVKPFLEVLAERDYDHENEDVVNIILSKIIMYGQCQDKAKKAYKKMNKKKISKISKVLDKLPELDAVDMAIAYETLDSKELGFEIYVFRVLKYLYINSEYILDKLSKQIGEDEWDYKKFYKWFDKLVDCLSGKKKDKFIISILLEEKSVYHTLDSYEQTLWNRLTTYSVNYINDKDKKEVKKLLKLYTEMRLKTTVPTNEKRIKLLAHLNEEDFANILKVGNKLCKKDSEDYKDMLDWLPEEDN